MTRGSIREYAVAACHRYLKVGRRQKAAILDEFCKNTGYHRKSAIRLLRRRPQDARGRTGRPRKYGLEVLQALKKLWEVGDRPCGKRLEPFVAELLEALERHGEIELEEPIRKQLLELSAATIDRLLKPYRQKGVRKPYSQSQSVPSLKARIPVRTFGDWSDVKPGSFQADLVMHCGETTEGFHLTTLDMVDVATGWNECQAVWGKGQRHVGTAVHMARQRLPFPLRELHTDNGGEFLNEILYPWCIREGIGFTRGRPYKKNDQAHVEQKNWTSVRRLVGYDRYSSKQAFAELAEFYRLRRLYVNFFQPIRKLVGKERIGAKVKKQFDEARTPYRRLLAAGALDNAKQEEMAGLYAKQNPAKLRKQIDSALNRLWELADRPESMKASKQAKEDHACG